MPRSLESYRVTTRDLLAGLFHDQLPKKSLSCRGYARLIAQVMGGPDEARIYWVSPHQKTERARQLYCHAYVIPRDAKDDDVAYNCWFGPATVGEIRAIGEDETDTVFNTPWNNL